MRKKLVCLTMSLCILLSMAVSGAVCEKNVKAVLPEDAPADATDEICIYAEDIIVNNNNDQKIYVNDEVNISIVTYNDSKEDLEKNNIKSLFYECFIIDLNCVEHRTSVFDITKRFETTDTIKTFVHNFTYPGTYRIQMRQYQDGIYCLTECKDIIVYEKNAETVQATPEPVTQAENISLSEKFKCLKLKAKPGSRKITGKLSDKVDKVMVKVGNKKYKKAKLKGTKFKLKTSKLKKGTKVQIKVYRTADGKSISEKVKVIKVK